MNIKEIIKKPEYDFLQTNEHLGKNICLLTFGGSHSYGTNVETSDIDLRGIALNKPQEILGLSNFEQVQCNQTDTTIFAFRKVINLLLNCNPNIVELLGCKDEHYVIKTKIGQQILDNTDLFLTQKASRSFGGYANSQLRRLQNALARDNYPQTEKEKHILNSINNQLSHFEENYTKEHGIKLYIDKSEKDDYENEIFMNVSNFHYPLRDFKAIYSEMNNVVKDYSKLNNRNKKKDDLHLNKHFMHLIRLYIMATEILEGKGVNTYRENDRELLLEIRNGKFQNEDSSYKPEAFELIDELSKKMEYAEKHTELPKKPDMKRVEEFVMDVQRSVINGTAY